MDRAAHRLGLCMSLRTHACPHQPRRYFSQSPSRCSAGAKITMPQMRQPAQKSMRVLAQEAARGDGANVLPNDMGLLDGECDLTFLASCGGERSTYMLIYGTGTFIMPVGKNKPSLIQLPRERLNLEWFRLKRRFLDFGGCVRQQLIIRQNSCTLLMVRCSPCSVLYYKWFITKKPNSRPMLALRNTGPIASALHRQMYTAFAE